MCVDKHINIFITGEDPWRGEGRPMGPTPPLNKVYGKIAMQSAMHANLCSSFINSVQIMYIF